MPLKMGTDAKTMSNNVKEMMKAGHPQKNAIAAAYSMKRKSMKKMAEGGQVSEDYDEGAGSDDDQNAERGLVEINEMGKYHPAQVASPEQMDAEQMFAKKLFEKSEDEEMGYAEGGLIEEMDHDGPDGATPMLDWINDGTEEPMSSEPMKAADTEHKVIDGVPASMGLSEETMQAIRDKKKGRRYTMRG